jgi:cytochrome c oxidase cbb3-type subunit I/II
MPTYQWLAQRKTNFASIPARLKTMQALGVPYTNDAVTNGTDLAKAQANDIAARIIAQDGPKNLQDKEIIALIAYLQRIGTDLVAKPAPTTAPSTSTQEGAH